MENIKIAIVGAGTMGSEVALTLACHGLEVILKDVHPEALEKSRKKIGDDIRMVKMMIPGFKNVTAPDVLARIAFTLDFDLFPSANIVVENVSERWETKQDLYNKLKSHTKPNTVFFVNTSCISITKVAALTPHPDKVIGVHFMNPVALKELAEVVVGHHTSEATVSFAKEFLSRIRKKAIVVNDYPGFVANRLSHLFMNEAAFLIQDQVASAKDIDMIFKKGYGHSMGPLETADLIGLDTVVDSLEVLYIAYQDTKFRCCPLLRRMVHAGLLGKKSGQGFYTY